jgi:hypothetical protein
LETRFHKAIMPHLPRDRRPAAERKFQKAL